MLRYYIEEKAVEILEKEAGLKSWLIDKGSNAISNALHSDFATNLFSEAGKKFVKDPRFEEKAIKIIEAGKSHPAVQDATNKVIDTFLNIKDKYKPEIKSLAENIAEKSKGIFDNEIKVERKGTGLSSEIEYQKNKAEKIFARDMGNKVIQEADFKGLAHSNVDAIDQFITNKIKGLKK